MELSDSNFVPTLPTLGYRSLTLIGALLQKKKKNNSTQLFRKYQGGRVGFCTFSTFYLWRDEWVHSGCVQLQAFGFFVFFEEGYSLLKYCGLAKLLHKFSLQFALSGELALMVAAQSVAVPTPLHRWKSGMLQIIKLFWRNLISVK